MSLFVPFRTIETWPFRGYAPAGLRNGSYPTDVPTHTAFGLRRPLGISSQLMLVLEMPFAYADNSQTKNDATGEGKADNLFGIGDVSARVFYVPYKKEK